ncbi:MAG: shikimate dehydrogenase [Thermodesulfobacteriota bacterium]
MKIPANPQFDSKTLLYGVFGNPVAHSLSPVMHNAAFRQLNHNGVYLAFRVENIASGIEAVRALNMQGVSITIPHKIEVMSYLDELDPMAERIGSVNTVTRRNGRLIGYNTDASGAVAALAEKAEISQKRVAVIGAGGAARAVGFGVRSEGAEVTIINRTYEKGKALAEELDGDFCPAEDFESLAPEILINTTSVGMSPHTEGIPVPPDCLREGMVVMDIVYNPLTTRLLKEAENRGCLPVDGVAMFVYQGAFQFELWTGMKAPVEIMRSTVLKALEKRI